MLVDTLALDELHRLPHEAMRALQTLGDAPSGEAGDARIEVNVAWLFAFERDWSNVVSLGASLFIPEHIPYLLKRAAEASRPLLRAHYSIAAWLSQRRREYAVLAADSLIATIDEYATSADDRERFAGLRRAMVLAYGIAAAAGKSDDVRARALALVRDLRPPFDLLRAETAKTLANDTKAGPDVLATLSDVIGDLMHGLATFDRDLLRQLAALGRRVDARLQRPPDAKWDRLLGESLTAWIESHPEPIVKALGAQEAAAAFARAGDDSKVLAMRAVTSKALAEQETITFEMPLEGAEDFHAHVRLMFRSIFNEEGADGALRMLAVGPHVIPDVESIRAHEEQMEREGIGAFFHATVESHEVSADGRIIDHAAPGQEQVDRSFTQGYGLRVDGTARMATTAFVEELVISTEVTLDDVMLLLGRTWFGKRDEPSAQQEDTLLTLMRPALRAWFDVCLGDRIGDELVLIGDSLVPKVETALRKLARNLGIPHLRSVDRGGKIVDEYLGLEILDHDDMKSALGVDLVTFLEYVLDRPSEGFRDRVAHGAALPHEYAFSSVGLVVLAILRLAGQPVRRVAPIVSDGPR